MEKLSMGEYTEVVWAAYIVAFVVLGLISLASVRGLKRQKQRLQDIEPDPAIRRGL